MKAELGAYAHIYAETGMQCVYVKRTETHLYPNVTPPIPGFWRADERNGVRLFRVKVGISLEGEGYKVKRINRFLWPASPAHKSRINYTTCTASLKRNHERMQSDLLDV